MWFPSARPPFDDGSTCLDSASERRINGPRCRCLDPLVKMAGMPLLAQNWIWRKMLGNIMEISCSKYSGTLFSILKKFSTWTLDISQISRKAKLQRKPCTSYTSLKIGNHWERLTPWYHKVSLQQIQWMFGVPLDGLEAAEGERSGAICWILEAWNAVLR